MHVFGTHWTTAGAEPGFFCSGVGGVEGMVRWGMQVFDLGGGGEASMHVKCKKNNGESMSQKKFEREKSPNIFGPPIYT